MTGNIVFLTLNITRRVGVKSGGRLEVVKLITALSSCVGSYIVLCSSISFMIVFTVERRMFRNLGSFMGGYRWVGSVASARRSGQEDFQRGTPPVSLASCSISPFLRACIITE